ncbi:MAG: hypothetical protein L6275_04290 [Candidatus Portnoybacteria bacterium]|nr:hypothetical protein [Candidatus Portnoybacteria bacterium]
MDNTISLKKYLLTVALGFGLGGLIWGVVMYMGIPDIEYTFHYSFAIALSIFGGIALQWFSKSAKKMAVSVLVVFVGLVIGFIVTAILGYILYLYGGLFLSSLGYLIEIETLNKFLNLPSNIAIGDFWLFFFIMGIIVSFLYSLFFKLKKWPMIWRGGVGFALGSLIAPVIGNSFGFLFDCQMISYLLTFSLMSAIFGVFLAWGVWGSE